MTVPKPSEIVAIHTATKKTKYMRTKTTILSAVALAAGLLSASAQVYSANVVGYYNVTVPQGGFAFVANQLKGAGGNNQINNQLKSGFVSDPAGNNNSVLYFWTGSAFTAYQWYIQADSGLASDGWVDGGGNLTTVSLNQGAGAFLYNPPAGQRTTNTIVGEVPQGTISNYIAQGFSPFAIKVPVSTNVDSAFVNYPGHSPADGNGNTYDTLYQFFNGAFRTATWEEGADTGGGPNGFYDGGGNPTATQPSWNMRVGEAFFIYHTNPNNVTNWVSSFTVQ